MRHLIAVAALALACGGSDDPKPPTCQPGEVAVVGTLDNTSISERVTVNSSIFVNGGIDTGSGPQDGSYQAGITADGGTTTVVRLDFKDLIPDGQSAPARAEVDFSSFGGPHVGNCETGDLVSTISIDADGNGGTFVLRDPHDAPFCSGAAHSGALAGCWR